MGIIEMILFWSINIFSLYTGQAKFSSANDHIWENCFFKSDEEENLCVISQQFFLLLFFITRVNRHSTKHILIKCLIFTQYIHSTGAWRVPETLFFTVTSTLFRILLVSCNRNNKYLYHNIIIVVLGVV